MPELYSGAHDQSEVGAAYILCEVVPHKQLSRTVKGSQLADFMCRRDAQAVAPQADAADFAAAGS